MSSIKRAALAAGITVDQVQFVLETIREPTDAMVEAGDKELVCESVWMAMIDELLQEKMTP